MSLTSKEHDSGTLRDGREVLISRLTPADAPILADAFERLSEESRRLRFLGPKPSLTTAELRYLTEVDGHQHEALCAIDPGTGRGVAIGRFVRDRVDPDRAEVAITVADDWQGQGLGKIMLSRLADRAREEHVRSFTALVSTDNRGMQALLKRMAPPAKVHHVGNGIAEYEIELAPKGLGSQLEEALRAAAAGHFQLPPRVCDMLRALVPLRLREERSPRRSRPPSKLFG
jgi:RimJ/RimL family protein N-acetyltransferase